MYRLLAGLALLGLLTLCGCSYQGDGNQDGAVDDGSGDGGDNGENAGLTGSQCNLMNCLYDIIECYRYSAPNDAIVVHYIQTLSTGNEWIAKITIDLQGITQVEGLRLDGSDFLNRVTLTKPGPGEQWPDFEGDFCEFTKGGDQIGEEMSGKCAFAFTNGFDVTAEFTCTLENIQP